MSIVEDQVLDMTDVAIRCFDVMTDDGVATAQMVIVRLRRLRSSMTLHFLFHVAVGRQAARYAPRPHTPEPPQ